MKIASILLDEEMGKGRSCYCDKAGLRVNVSVLYGVNGKRGRSWLLGKSTKDEENGANHGGT